MTYELGNLDGGGTYDHTEDGDIHVRGKVDGGSRVTLTANGGSISIDGKIDGGSRVTLVASGSIKIGILGDDGDKKIDGGSELRATAGTGIDLGNKIDGGSHVWFNTTTGSIHVHDKIDGGSHVIYWPQGRLKVDGGVNGGSKTEAQDWS